jgi:hypothetical protein
LSNSLKFRLTLDGASCLEQRPVLDDASSAALAPALPARAVSLSVSSLSDVLSDQAGMKTRAATLNGQSGRVQAGAANVKCRRSRERLDESLAPERLSGGRRPGSIEGRL